MSAVPVFIARGLTKTYGSGAAAIHALRDPGVEIAEGGSIVLLGPSGSGTCTLLNILGGLDAPAAGRARWRNHEVTGADEAALTACRREHVGFVPARGRASRHGAARARSPRGCASPSLAASPASPRSASRNSASTWCPTCWRRPIGARRSGDGFRATARIVTEHRPRALLVPVHARFRRGEEMAVFAVAHRRAEERRVVLAARGERVAVVQGGLLDGARVVVFPPAGVAEGRRVAGARR